MPCRSLDQSSFFDPEFVMPGCLTPGTVPWVLARHRSLLLPSWLFAGWRGEGKTGRKAWPAVVMATLWLLRWSEEGSSRLGSLRRAKTDLAWRAAAGLNCDVMPPDERTMRDFEKLLQGRHPACGVPRFLLLHEHVVRLGLAEGLTADGALWATDSTPMWCYGAVLDTVRLLGDGLRQLAQRWTRATRSSLEDVAARWELPLLLAKSTKGSYRIDWRDKDARANVVDDLAGAAVRLAEWVRRHIAEARPAFRRGLLRRCRQLLRVVQSDLETDARGRLVVARKVARDRLVSLTDPQARHGRKSRSRRFNGFKLHVLGDLVSGLIAAVAVTAGNQHDGGPAHRLIRRAKDLLGDMEQVLGDTAYGGSDLVHRVRETLGVELLTPPPPNTHPKNGKLGKSDFEIDFAAGTATCPNGVTTDNLRTTHHRKTGLPTRRYRWPKEACAACPLRSSCCDKGRRSRSLALHPLEEQLRAHRENWMKPETRETYRRRGEFERLVHEPVRHGARKARAWGLATANVQAHGVVTACNLRLLAKFLAARDGPAASVASAA